MEDGAVRDVVVVGAGVVGLACAQALAAAGRAVVVLDAAGAGAGASSGNTGWIVPSLSTPLAAPGMLREGLRSALDPRGALVLRPTPDTSWMRWLWQFRRYCEPARYRAGVRALVELNRRTLRAFDELAADGVEFDEYRGGMLLVARTPHGLDWFRALHGELVELGHDATLTALTPAEARELEPALSPSIASAMRTSVDRYVRPESLTSGLAAWLRARGVEVLEQRPVEQLRPYGDHWRAVTPLGTIEAQHVVVASGAATRALVAPLGLDLPLVGAKGYSVTLRGTGTAPSRALYLSDAKLGTSAFGDELRIAGVFELPGRTPTADPGRIRALVDQALSYLADWRPDTSSIASTAWAGLRPATPDGLPLIGPVYGLPGLVVATGHGMLGVTLAPATAQVVASIVCEGTVPLDAVPFLPSRRL